MGPDPDRLFGIRLYFQVHGELGRVAGGSNDGEPGEVPRWRKTMALAQVESRGPSRRERPARQRARSAATRLARSRRRRSPCGPVGSFGHLGRHQDRRRHGSHRGCKKPASLAVAGLTLPARGRARVAAPRHRSCISDAVGSCGRRARREARRRGASRSSPREFGSAGYCRGLELDARTRPLPDRIGFAESRLAASVA